MTEGIITKSFSLNFKVMKAIGLYHPEKTSFLFKLYAYVLYFVALVPTPVLGFLYILLEEDLDKEQMSYNAIVVVSMASFPLKLLPFIQNRQRIAECIHYFESPFFAVVKGKQIEMIEECIYVSLRNSRGFFGVTILAFLGWFTRPVWSGNNGLPLDIWLPFPVPTNSAIYYIIYLIISIGVAYSALSSFGVDTLIGGLACHVAGQVKVLKDNLQFLDEYADEEISQNQSKSKKTISKSIIIYNKIKQCVIFHKAILEFVNEFEECFSMTVFHQFLGSILVTGFGCLHISQLPLMSVEFFIMMTFFFSIMGQFCFYCYYGTLLFEESNMLVTAVYMSKWYEYNLKSKNALCILMENARKPMVVVAGKLFDLSLQTFMVILKRSYSVVAVLKNF